jgi:hypothetical protein
VVPLMGGMVFIVADYGALINNNLFNPDSLRFGGAIYTLNSVYNSAGNCTFINDTSDGDRGAPCIFLFDKKMPI